MMRHCDVALSSPLFQCTESSATTREASVDYIGGTMAVASLSAHFYLLPDR
jgi:hypothetical protein